ncbi:MULTISPECIES: DUF4365 domain-containing protein [Vibrio]|uniref:DUF4365 domain-containing protein n=1 Tax=Vibrio TaxID=662 RepID=UPI000310774C|nr:DUF4365 domain-containing protein [Vibrio splendidus]OEE54134.1 hypothetical protein A146_13625 [Vibrio splendidus FF-500]
MSKRTYSHVIDTKSVKKVLNIFPEHWVVRELSERDYGIDLVIEIFLEDGHDRNGNQCYTTSGCLCNIQVKGTDKKLNIIDESVKFSLAKNALQYVEKFAVPFLLLRVNVSEPDSETYFVWLQRYIKDVLEFDFDNWREEPQESFTIKIPKSNSVLGSLDKIENIAFRLKYIEELVEYTEIYGKVSPMITAIGQGSHPLDEEVYNYIRNELKKTLRLKVLMARNHVCVNEQSVHELINSVCNALGDSSLLNSLIDHKNKYNLDLLASSVDSVCSLEDSIAENLGSTVY